MTETILVILAVFAALAVLARRVAMPDRSFPEPLDPAAEVPEKEEADDQSGVERR